MRSSIVVACLAFGACSNPSPVGGLCDLGAQPDPDEVMITTGVRDCASRTCLRVTETNPNPPAGAMEPTGTDGLCTATCASDDDCAGVQGSPCVTGFACAIPPGLTAGPMCCTKLCVCRDYVAPDVAEPDACDATNAANACCNLSGRTGNPQYPACTAGPT